jgi:hypothetical protein
MTQSPVEKRVIVGQKLSKLSGDPDNQGTTVLFQTGYLEVTSITYHNPKRTNWESYQEDVKVNLVVVP